jgi:hypothetical protein
VDFSWAFFGNPEKKKKMNGIKAFGTLILSKKKKKNENEDVQLHGICLFSNHENKLKA